MAARAAQEDLTKLLTQAHLTLGLFVARYDQAHLLTRTPLPPNKTVRLHGATWRCAQTLSRVADRPDAVDLRLTFTLVKGHAEETAVGIELAMAKWNPANYLLLPAAAYNGNRFLARRGEGTYWKKFPEPEDLRPDNHTFMTDVPRLNLSDGPSRLQQLTRDLATPAVGIFAPATGTALLLLTPQATPCGDTGLDLEESPDRRHAWLRLTAPGMREDTQYTICDNQKPSTDRAASFAPGDHVTLHLRLYVFPSPTLQGLFDRFVQVRKDLTGPVTLHHQLPFAAAWDIQETKYNHDNWAETEGYYAVGLRENKGQDWQVGWTGGGINTYPLLAHGSELSQTRALRTIEWLLGPGQTKLGFFTGFYHKGEWSEDTEGHLVRRNGDALYYLLKHVLLLTARQPGWQAPPHWREGIRRCADAFVRTWQKCGQWGQYLDPHTGDVTVGGSTSGGIVPAALALAGAYLGEKSYQQVAAAAAEMYHRDFVQRGFTTGGPGDALQCPDSESAAGLLESFVTLYETTADKRWVSLACDLAHQCATWVTSYDFAFPPASTFGRLGMHTAGTVFANVQNKHSAPGMCVYSGWSLLKLFRATGNRFYLELLQEIAHALPQYLSRADRPISDPDGKPMPPGFMNERVNLSDWLEPIGEIFYGSCWCETTLMVTYTEVPGLYVQPDTGLVCALDHVEARLLAAPGQAQELEIHNPTNFPAAVRLLVEPSTHMSTPLGQTAWLNYRTVPVPAGGTVRTKLG